jgi:outer membrane protein assembly factor BamB
MIVTVGFDYSGPARIRYVVSAVRLSDGQEVWRFSPEHDVEGCPVLWEDFVLFGSNDTHLYIVDRFTGELLYKMSVEQPLTADLAVKDGIVIAASSNGCVYSVDIKERKPLWKFKGKAQFRAAPCIVDDVVYAGDNSGHIYALKLRTGELLWEYDAGGHIVGSLSSDGTILSFVTSTGYLFVLGNAD